MCGRFTQVRPWSELVRLYQITAAAHALNLPLRYNIAPTDKVPIIRRRGDDGARELVLARWGLLPPWAKDIKTAVRAINARAETVHSLPTFRNAFERRRCLVVADGFYEWKALPAGKKQPYYITLPENQTFAFAGLWEIWRSPAGEWITSCSIIVTTANALLQPIHDRMPVILDPDRFDQWLDPAQSPAVARALLVPYAGRLTLWPVTGHVGSVGNDDPACLTAIGPAVTTDGTAAAGNREAFVLP